MLALAELGYVQEARRAMEKIDVVGTVPQRVLRDVAEFLIEHGKPQELIDYVDRHFGSLDNLLATYPVSRTWSIGYLPELAYAHMQLGNEEIANRLINEAVAAIENQRKLGFDNWPH